jgi:toxin ParE1/3/4
MVSLWTYLAENQTVADADHVTGKLKQIIRSLGETPERGHVPPELERVHATGFLQVHFKPYRIIYQMAGTRVYVFCVLDGRRDIESVLRRRLLSR